MPPTVSKFKAVPIPRKDSGEEKGGVRRRVADCPVLKEEGKVSLLVRDVDKGAPANVNYEQLDVLDYIGFGQFLNFECYSECR